MTTTDLTFITNEGEANLLNRFKNLIKDTQLFDCIVGYFYASGFHAIYKELETTEKIRILIGISTNQKTYGLIERARQTDLTAFSHAEIKASFSGEIISEMEASPDTQNVEEGVKKFIEWVRNGKLEIRAYPSDRIHAKLYIMTFREGDRDVGRVITGSSNFTEAGFVDNLEFNVELKNSQDYTFAKQQFERLWENSVEVSQEFVNTVQSKTWVNDELTPYELYLKFLYEHFKEKINLDKDKLDFDYLPSGFLRLEYQNEAVKDAKSKLEQYGGVFISDVVGLGKTYIASMLAREIGGRTLIIAPPTLIDPTNPGSWENARIDFGIAGKCESLGKLDKLLKQDLGKFDNVIIDEAHRFRNETNVTYENLARICRGKRIILVSATPYNNSPNDILSQLKLFQDSKKSTLPNMPNLDSFFKSLDKKFGDLDRFKDRDEYLHIIEDNAREIRKKILDYVMIRRTRSEVQKYFSKDLKMQGLSFPEVEDPIPLFYELSEKENSIFEKTLELITQSFTYARYKPLLYYKKPISQEKRQAQIQLGTFMKLLLVKRLESSFYAFRKSLERFIHSYDLMIKTYKKGYVYTSKHYTNKIFDYIEQDDDSAIDHLLEEGKAERYAAKDFSKELLRDLENDLGLLRKLKNLWSAVQRDPKLQRFIKELSTQKVLKDNKLIIFTESKETAEYLAKELKERISDDCLLFTGSSKSNIREDVIDNFDAKARVNRDEYRLLITTEVLSEGVNLHRSNTVINYDIPWNPTRLMQRVGRINRIDTKFKKIYTYNFFPTVQANTELKLTEAAIAKIHAFIEMLGNDAKLLTEMEEIKSHDLFNKLTSKETILGKDESENSELKYLAIIRDLRDNNSKVFEKIKRLPKKARTAKIHPQTIPATLTYFRKGKLQKFYLANDNEVQELDFLAAANILSCSEKENREKLSSKLYELLDKNKRAFSKSIDESDEEEDLVGSRDRSVGLLKILKSKQMRNYPSFTDDDEAYLRKVRILIENGALPGHTLKNLKKELKDEINPYKIYGKIRNIVSPEFFTGTYTGSAAQISGPQEVILSEYLVPKNG